MRKRHIGVIALSVVCTLLTGCWDRSELNELAITSAASLDRDKDRWVLSYQVLIPSAISGVAGMAGGGSSQVPVVVYSTNGRTVKEAVSFSFSETPRKLFFAHNSLLVVSEKAARVGIGQMIDLYLRNPDSRETVNIMIAPDQARTILEQLMNIERIPGQGLQRLIEKESKNMSDLPNTRMYELAMDLAGESKSALVPEIIISGVGEVNSLDQLKKTTQPSKVRLGRVAVIKDDKMTGWLTRDEALGVSFIKNTIKTTTIPFACRKDSDGSKADSTFQLMSSSTKVTPTEKNGHFEMAIAVEVKGKLNETDCSIDLIKPEVVKEMEEQLQKKIAEITESGWKAAQKLDADVVGFYDTIKRKYPKQWKTLKKDKSAILKDAVVTVQVGVTMTRVGLSNKSFEKLKGD